MAKGIVHPLLFSSLSRWASRQDENFTTEVFVFVLRFLLKSEPAIAKSLLTKLCGFDFDTDECNSDISISTQQTFAEGRPDIQITTSKLLAFVEVKKESGLQETQIARYRKAIDRLCGNRQAKLILLTQYPVQNCVTSQGLDLHWRWQDVADWMVDVRLQSETAQYLCSQFVSYLKGENMVFDKVDWHYIEGYKAFRNLIAMIAKALETCNVNQVKTSAGIDWTGFYLDKELWVGIPHYRHNMILIEIQPKAQIDLDKLKHQTEVHEVGGKNEIRLDLEAEDLAFFSKGKDAQLTVIVDFIRKNHQLINDCRIRTT